MCGSSFSLLVALAARLRGWDKTRAVLEGKDLWDLQEMGAGVLEYCHGFICRAGEETGGLDLGEQRENSHF